MYSCLLFSHARNLITYGSLHVNELMILTRFIMRRLDRRTDPLTQPADRPTSVYAGDGPSVASILSLALCSTARVLTGSPARRPTRPLSPVRNYSHSRLAPWLAGPVAAAGGRVHADSAIAAPAAETVKRTPAARELDIGQQRFSSLVLKECTTVCQTHQQTVTAMQAMTPGCRSTSQTSSIAATAQPYVAGKLSAARFTRIYTT